MILFVGVCLRASVRECLRVWIQPSVYECIYVTSRDCACLRGFVCVVKSQRCRCTSYIIFTKHATILYNYQQHLRVPISQCSAKRDLEYTRLQLFGVCFVNIVLTSLDTCTYMYHDMSCRVPLT